MKYTKEEVLNILLQEKLIGVLRDSDYNNLIFRERTAIEKGVKVSEIALNSVNPYNAIGQLVEEYPDAIIGAGTVLCAEDGARALMHGAKFLVSPVYVKEVHNLAVERDVLYIPGAMTPSELFDLHKKGIEIIKLFPADYVDANYLKSILAPLKGINVIPFGGVNKTNVKKWFNAGAKAVAVGSALYGKANTPVDVKDIAKNVKVLMEEIG